MSRPTDDPGIFVHRRRLSFGDSDGAGIVYTPRIAHFGLEAIEAWFLERIGLDWLHLNKIEKMGTPFVRMEVDFLSPMTPPAWLDTEVLLEKAGRSSLSFRLSGRIGSRLCWRAAYVCVFVATDTPDGAYGAIAIPERYKAAILAQAQHGAPSDSGDR